MSALYKRQPVVIPLTPSADQSGKEGYTVGIAGEVATISASATVPVRGVILDGNDVDGKSAVGILGALEGSVLMKTSGVITKGDRVMQAADGTILTDAGANARVLVGVAMESGAAGELIEVATHVPLTLA
jgi:hypothetical protein